MKAFPKPYGIDFETLCLEHSAYVLNLMTHLMGPTMREVEIEDLAHEVFQTARRKIDQGEQIVAPRAWLEMVSVQTASRARRTRWLNGVFRATGGEAVGYRAPDSRLKEKESSRELYGMLEKLTEKKRTAVILHELMGLSVIEVAATLKCPVNTVYARLRHARAEMLEMRRSAARRPGKSDARVGSPESTPPGEACTGSI